MSALHQLNPLAARVCVPDYNMQAFQSRKMRLTGLVAVSSFFVLGTLSYLAYPVMSKATLALYAIHPLAIVYPALLFAAIVGSGLYLAAAVLQRAIKQCAEMDHAYTLKPYEMTQLKLKLLEEVPKMDTEPKEPFRFDEEVIAQVLAGQVEEKPGRFDRKMIENRQMISLTELKSGVRLCAEHLFKQLVGKKWAVCSTPKKSSHWIAQYAMKFCPDDNQPLDHCRHGSGSLMNGAAGVGAISNAFLLRPDVTDLVYFDDVAYSGRDLTVNIIPGTVRALGQREGSFTFWVVVPFISPVTVEKLNKLKLPENVELKVVTTDYKMQTLKDLFPGEEIPYIYGQWDQTTTATAWKIPDNASFSSQLRQGWPRRYGDDRRPKTLFIQPDPATLPCYKSQAS